MTAKKRRKMPHFHHHHHRTDIDNVDDDLVGCGLDLYRSRKSQL